MVVLIIQRLLLRFVRIVIGALTIQRIAKILTRVF
jgi:hypothetical protein